MRNIDARRLIGNRGSIANELSDQRYSAGQSNISKAVVIDVINDPSLLNTPESPLAQLQIDNPQYARLAPRNSIVAKIITDAQARNSDVATICFPFFPPHMMMPVNAGETVWVITDNTNGETPIQYWMCRVPEPIFVDDVNYTHSDRRFEREGPRSLAERAAGPAPEDATRPGFPNGTNTRDGYTIAGDEVSFERLVARSSGYAQTVKEAVPRYTKRPGDTVIQGSNNTLISLGIDRVASGLDDRVSSAVTRAFQDEYQNKGSIDIVAGRGQADPTSPQVVTNVREQQEVDKRPGNATAGSETPQNARPREGDPDYASDLSRVYVSMRTDGDSNFGLEPYVGSPENSTTIVDDDAFVIAKSNNVRVISREDGTVRIVKEGANRAVIQLEADGKVIIDGPTIVIGSGTEGQTFVGDGATESMVLGDEFMKRLKEFLDVLAEPTVTVGNLGIPLGPINVAARALSELIEVRTFRSDVAKVK